MEFVEKFLNLIKDPDLRARARENKEFMETLEQQLLEYSDPMDVEPLEFLDDPDFDFAGFMYVRGLGILPIGLGYHAVIKPIIHTLNHFPKFYKELMAKHGNHDITIKELGWMVRGLYDEDMNFFKDNPGVVSCTGLNVHWDRPFVHVSELNAEEYEIFNRHFEIREMNND